MLEGDTSLTAETIFDLARKSIEAARVGRIKFVDGACAKPAKELYLDMRSTGLSYAMSGINAAGKRGGVIVTVRDEGMEAPKGSRGVLVHLDIPAADTHQVSLLFEEGFELS